MLSKILARTVLPSRRASTPFVDMFIPRTDAAVRVDADTAFRWSSSWACIRVIAETIAGIDWLASQKIKKERKDRPKHIAQQLLTLSPNNEMTPFTWRETTVTHALTWGDGFSEIERDLGGRPTALWPIEPHRVDVLRGFSEDIDHFEEDAEGGIIYRVRSEDMGGFVYLQPEDVFHVKGPSPDGIVGYYVVALFAQAFALGIASERHTAQFFGNHAIPAGLLEREGRLDKTKAQKLIAEFEERHLGQRKIGLLQGGMKWVQVAATNEDSQLAKTREFQTLEACRIYRVPPHKVADLSRATFSNISEQETAFARDTIAPWATRLEQEADRKLIHPQERVNGYRTKLKLQSIMRGDAIARAKYYKERWNIGAITINQILEEEDENGIGPNGDERFVPANFTTITKLVEAPAPILFKDRINKDEVVEDEPKQLEDKSGNDDSEEMDKKDVITDLLKPILLDHCESFVNHEVIRVVELWNKYQRDKKQPRASATFLDDLGKFYDGHTQHIKQKLTPTLAALDPDTETIDNLCSLICDRSKQAVEEESNVSRLLSLWKDKKPQELVSLILEGVKDATT